MDHNPKVTHPIGISSFTNVFTWPLFFAPFPPSPFYSEGNPRNIDRISTYALRFVSRFDRYSILFLLSFFLLCLDLTGIQYFFFFILPPQEIFRNNSHSQGPLPQNDPPFPIMKLTIDNRYVVNLMFSASLRRRSRNNSHSQGNNSHRLDSYFLSTYRTYPYTSAMCPS